MDGKDQPMTLNMRLDHVEIDTIRALMQHEIELFPLLKKERTDLPSRASRLSVSGFANLMQQGMDSGELTLNRDIILFFETHYRNEVIVNMTRIHDENPVDPWSLTRAEQEGRRQVWELFAFLRKHVPGFKYAELKYTGPRIGIRSSRRLCGHYSLTSNDILTGTKFPDGIVANGYPIDVHSPDDRQTNSTHLSYGQYYTIPYRCLYSPHVANLLVAGRNISATFEAQASTRVSPCCGALGECAGTAAALACKYGVDVRELSMDILQTKLREQQMVID